MGGVGERPRTANPATLANAARPARPAFTFPVSADKPPLIGSLHPGSMDDVQVGSIIRSVRIRRGLTQTQVAEAARVSRSMV